MFGLYDNYSNTGVLRFGFTDGSWGTLLVPDDKEFLTLFPGTLTHKERIP